MLSIANCESLLAKISARIDLAEISARIGSWLVKKLSFVGRLQLLSSVLLSLQIFWAKVYILPKKVIRLLEQKFNRFLWCGSDSKVKAKVAWEKLCVPKKE